MNDTNLKEALDAFQRGDLDRARTLAESSTSPGTVSAKVEHLLGLIQCRMGNPGAGADHFRSAMQAEAGNPHHQIMLARALVDSGRAAEALELAKPQAGPAAAALWHARAEAAAAVGDDGAVVEALGGFAEAQPADWRAWNNYGDKLAQLERWGEAAAALGKAVQLNPAEASLRRNLAAALAQGGFEQESITELRDAIRLDPADIESRIALGAALDGLGRFDEALEAYQDAFSIPAAADRCELALARARLLVRLIRFSDAEAAYHDLIRKNPSDSQAVMELGLLLERVGKLDELKDLLSTSAEAGVPAEKLNLLHAAISLRAGNAIEARALLLETKPEGDPAPWYRLKAKVEDELGNAEEAFAAATDMNRSVANYEDWLQRGADYRARVRNLHGLITPEWAARLLPLQSSDGRSSPVFLVGFPRSGTTLLDTFLMGHPQTSVLEEVHLLGEAEMVVADIATLPDLPPETLQKARDAYFALLDKHVAPGTAGLVVDKMPLNMMAAQLIYALFPDARLVFAQRHPCDCVISGFMQAFLLNDAMASFLDLQASADLYDAANSLWTRNRELFPLNMHAVSYEGLVSDPEAELRPLLSFLGLEWQPELLDHRKTAEERGTIITASYDQVTQPLHEKASGRWRRYEKQLEPVLPVLLPWAERLGYSD